MQNEQALLNAVIEHPDDDGPRLCYAAWLDDRGDPRGEFIRLQCRLAAMRLDPESISEIDNSGMPPDSEWGYLRHVGVYQEFEQRADELLKQHGVEWAGEFAGFKVTYHRGFVEAIHEVTVPDLLPLAEILFAAAPICELSVVLWDEGHLSELLESTWCLKLKALKLMYLQAPPTDVAQIAASPHLCRLERLDLSGDRFGIQDVLALLQSSTLTKLTGLDLSKDGETGRCASHAYVAPEELWFPPRSLNLSGIALDDAGVIELVGGVNLKRFQVLDLKECRIGDRGAAALADCPQLDTLDLLNLTQNSITDQGARALAASRYLNCRLLFVGMNPFDGIGDVSVGGKELSSRFGSGVHYFIY